MTFFNHGLGVHSSTSSSTTDRFCDSRVNANSDSNIQFKANGVLSSHLDANGPRKRATGPRKRETYSASPPDMSEEGGGFGVAAISWPSGGYYGANIAKANVTATGGGDHFPSKAPFTYEFMSGHVKGHRASRCTALQAMNKRSICSYQ